MEVQLSLGRYIFFIWILFSSCSSVTYSDVPLLNNQSIRNLEGEPITLNKFKEKNIILHFWATWCKVCIEEMYELEKVKLLLEKNNYELLLVSNESVDEIKDFKITHTNLNFTYVSYEGTFADLGIIYLPETFIYKGKKKETIRIKGAIDWTSKDILSILHNK